MTTESPHPSIASPCTERGINDIEEHLVIRDGLLVSTLGDASLLCAPMGFSFLMAEQFHTALLTFPMKDARVVGKVWKLE